MAGITNIDSANQQLDDLEVQNNDNLKQQQVLNDQIIDKGLEKTQAQVDFEKQQYEKDATKAATALNANYQKESNQYGTQNESLAAQGLQNSGYSESSRVNLYNNYQSNVTSIINELSNEKAKLDLQMNQAYLDADIQKAQNQVSILKQKVELGMQMYAQRFQVYQQQVSEYQFERQMALKEKEFNLNAMTANAQANLYNAQASYYASGKGRS